MLTKEQIRQEALKAEQERFPRCAGDRSNSFHGVNSAYGLGFVDGAMWANEFVTPIDHEGLKQYMESKDMAWKADLPAFFKEICECTIGGPYAKCFHIINYVLSMLTARAIELNDPILNVLMLNLSLYDGSHSKENIAYKSQIFELFSQIDKMPKNQLSTSTDAEPKSLSKEEYKAYYLTLDPGYVMTGNVDIEYIRHNDGSLWVSPYLCEEQFSMEEWRKLNDEYNKVLR